MERIENQYDVIVIGSGIGGMTCAGILAKLNKRKVLVLEKHSTPGGFTQEFERKGRYKWDVGLHYVNEMSEGTRPRMIMDYITDNNLKWNKIPDPFDKFVYPDFTFEVFSDPEKYMNDLIGLFPDEENAIRTYFDDVKKCASWWENNFKASFLPFYLKIPIQLLNIINRSKSLMTTQQYLDKNFKNARLKALLVSIWGDYGLVPRQSAFAIHALVFSTFFHGAYYPEGGAEQIARCIIPVVEKAGGKFLINKEVAQIIIENHQAIGVKINAKIGTTIKQEEYYAPAIVSDAGAFNTYLRLIPHEISIPFREEISSFPRGPSAVSLYLGLKDSPKKLGFKGENHWIYEGYNHNQAFDDTNSHLLEGKPTYCFLSFQSLKDPKSSTHIAEVITLCDYKIFEKWKDQPWLKREKEYYELKEKISDVLINLVEKHYRGFKDLIEYRELSTPLTIEHFTNRPRGEMYGVASTPERFTRHWTRVKTPVKNLYLTGSDACILGIFGATWGGVATASVLNGQLGLFKVMYSIGKSASEKLKFSS